MNDDPGSIMTFGTDGRLMSYADYLIFPLDIYTLIQCQPGYRPIHQARVQEPVSQFFGQGFAQSGLPCSYRTINCNRFGYFHTMSKLAVCRAGYQGG